MPVQPDLPERDQIKMVPPCIACCRCPVRKRQYDHKVSDSNPVKKDASNSDDSDKKYANLPSDKSLETITLEEALQCFALPREVWEYEWEKITAAIGRFWPYLKYKNIFASIPKNPEDPLDPHTITLQQAIPIIQKKLEFENNKNINQFEYEKEKIEVLNGPYGPYIKYNKKNYKIPKWWKDATDLNLEDCLSIIWLNKSKKTTTKKKASTKKK